MKKLFAFLACCFMLAPSLAQASVFRTDNINQTENISENAYVSGPSPIVAGTIQGDLMASGANVYVSGNVVQDAMLAGGTVNVTGHIGGDLRVFAGTLMIDGPVDGELLAFGGNVTIGPHAIIQGDVNIAGGHVQVDPSAKFASSKVNIRDEGKDDQQAPQPMFDTNKFLTAAFWITQLMLLVGIFVIVAIMHLLFPNFTKKFVQGSVGKGMFWKNFLIGLVMLIVMPIAAIFCFITGFGAILGILILVAYAAFIISSIIFAGVVFGGLLYELIKKPKKYNMGWWWLVLGVVGLHIIGWLPVVGWLIGFVFFLTAWGTIAMLRWRQMKST